MNQLPIIKLTKARLTALMLVFSLVFVQLFAGQTALADDYPAERSLIYHPLSEIGEYASQVCILRQSDRALRKAAFMYHSQSFVDAGCTPASISNALAMIFGVTDHDQAVTLLRETMSMLSNGNYKNSGCNLSLFNKMNKTGGIPEWNGLSGTEVLGPLVTAYAGDILFVDQSMTIEETMEQLLASPHMLLLSRRTLADDWSWLPILARALSDAGLGDARITLMQYSVGTNALLSPLCLSDQGHYISFYLQVDEYNTDGTIYMLDSIVRAVSLEEFYDHISNQTYPYIDSKNQRYREIAFNANFDLRRIADNTVQISLKYPLQREMLSLSPEARMAAMAERLSSMGLYGYGVIAIQLP